MKNTLRRVGAGVFSVLLMPLRCDLHAVAEETAGNAPAGVVINEACSSNKHSLQDAGGKSPDWIELYNCSEQPVELGGIGLSDGKKNPYKYVFPENTVLQPNAYLIVFCDGTDQHGAEEHANFKLSADGEKVYLTAADGTQLDMIEIPPLERDMAYGRCPDGSDHFARMDPSPGKANESETIRAYVDEPAFSAVGGFYDAEFELTLSADENRTILYTLDGSDPRTSETAVSYEAPIRIYDNTGEPNVLAAIKNISLQTYNVPKKPVDKGIVVRAACKDSDGLYSKVVTNNFFVGKNASYYTDMKVMAIATDSGNLFDDETGIYVVGSQYEAWKNSDQYDSSLKSANPANPTNYNMGGREWERPCTIQVFEQGEACYVEDVGMRISGNWSTVYPQKSLTLYARNEYGANEMKYDFFGGKAVDVNGNVIDRFKKVTLRNGGNDYENTKFKDDLNQELAEGLHFGKQTKDNYIVFIDGEFWGYYCLQEKQDEHYIESHYNIASKDVTLMKAGVFENGSEALYEEYVQFWNWAVSADMSDNENYQRVCDTIEISDLIDFMCFETYIVNRDCLIKPNNWIMWRASETAADNPYADGKWRMLAYDTDQSCGYSSTYSASYDILQHMDKSKKIESISSLFYCLMNNAKFRNTFYQRYHEIAATTFDTEIVLSVIDRYDANVKEAAIATFKRFGSNSNFEKKTDVIRDFYRTRGAYALEQLDSFYAKYPYTAGDLNSDGTVNLKDVVLLRRMIAGGWNVDVYAKIADFTGDSNVNLKDVVALRKAIANGEV